LRERIAALYAARLRADAEEVARLRAEVREWICGKCRAVYPGPPQPGCSCVVCPACGGDTMPRASYEIARLRAMVDEGREHLLWCGGSADFAPGGLARLGWERGPMVWLNSLAALDAKGGA
jgi:hypothetical protein